MRLPSLPMLVVMAVVVLVGGFVLFEALLPRLHDPTAIPTPNPAAPGTTNSAKIRLKPPLQRPIPPPAPPPPPPPPPPLPPPAPRPSQPPTTNTVPLNSLPTQLLPSSQPSPSPTTSAITSPPPRILITVKTTNDPPHRERANFIAETWFTRAPYDTYFFTETVPDDLPPLSIDQMSIDSRGGVRSDRPRGELLRDHWLTTGCPPSHGRDALCCKTNAQLNYFYTANGVNTTLPQFSHPVLTAVTDPNAQPRFLWFCHFDDDQYVMPDGLLQFLTANAPDPLQVPYYIGKRSLPDGIKLRPDLTIHFATGGAGYCMSWAAMRLAFPIVSKGQGFASMCSESGAPDDCSVGYLFITKLKIELRESSLFHSHLEHQLSVSPEHLHAQVSFGTLGSSYPVRGYTNPSRDNFANVKDLWPKEQDIMKFKALHCFLFPHTSYCPKPGHNFLPPPQPLQSTPR